MSSQLPNMAPFTEDPTEERLTEYVQFITSGYSPTLCEHKTKDDKMCMIGDEVDLIHLTTEKKGENEGSIYQKDLYTFCYHHLTKEKPEPKLTRQEEDLSRGEEALHNTKDVWNRRGYWWIEVPDSHQLTSPPLPVFQFATCCFEVHPKEEGVIKLGTEDVAHMLRSCIQSKGGRMGIPVGKKIMPTLGGLAKSDGKVRFRWCLRGPTLPCDEDSDEGGLSKKEKLKSLFRKANFRK